MPPLSEILRPKSLNEIAGQNHILEKSGWISQSILTKKPMSLLLYGPPGCGKTTLAKLYAQSFDARYENISAVFSNIAELKKIFQIAKDTPLFSQKLILFVDEIHRFNKAQQDAFLPYVEDGTIILIGATTENPSFSLNNALLSRLRILTLNILTNKDLESILIRYEEKFSPLHLTQDAKEYLFELSSGDARHMLNMIETLQSFSQKQYDLPTLERILQKKAPLYDKHADGHFNLISALHKSVRGSDPDASMYWFVRMIQAGEDPLYIARRLIRMAIEDIGLADPKALEQTHLAYNTYHMLGSPEGELALAQAVVYLALAPKSNAVYEAYKKAQLVAEKTNHLNPPSTIINAPTKWMKEVGMGKDYIYDHETALGFSGQDYFPKEMQRHSFYSPVKRGFEREMLKRIEYFSRLREKYSTSTNE